MGSILKAKQSPRIQTMAFPPALIAKAVVGVLFLFVDVQAVLRAAVEWMMELLFLPCRSFLLMFCVLNVIVSLLLVSSRNPSPSRQHDDGDCRCTSKEGAESLAQVVIPELEKPAATEEDEGEIEEVEESDEGFNRKIEDFIAMVLRERERELKLSTD